MIIYVETRCFNPFKTVLLSRKLLSTFFPQLIKTSIVMFVFTVAMYWWHSQKSENLMPRPLRWKKPFCCYVFRNHVYEDVIRVPLLPASAQIELSAYGLVTKCDIKYLAPVVQTLDNAIHRINRYPVDKC